VNRRLAMMVLCVSAVLLALVWRTLPSASPPLYDGLCLADPYRNLGTSPGPTSSSHTFASGAFPAAQVITSENPAQAQVLMPGGSFVASAEFTLSVTPVARPAPPLPHDRTFDSNVYLVTATTSRGIAVEPHQPVTILLRATASVGPARVIERLDGQRWTPLQTFNAGCGDTYEAGSSRLGDFAVVKLATAAPRSEGAPLGLILGAFVAVVAVAVVAMTVILTRRTRPSRPRR
jgi:hypothetical protein